MAEVNVTPVLRNTIKDYRKELKIRGDELSKKLRKNTSFISQLETGKIETISTNLLYKIFDELFANDDNKNKKIEDILKQMNLTLSDNELKHQRWLAIMDLQYRLLPIPDTIIEYIQSSLNDLNIDSIQLINIINENNDLKDDLSQEEIDNMEDNKVYPIFENTNYSTIIIKTHTKLNLPNNFIENIIEKKIKCCNFIKVHAIIYNILKLKGVENDTEALKQAEQFLFNNKFYTLTYKQDLPIYSDKLADYDIDFNKKLLYLMELLKDRNDKQPNFLNSILQRFNENIYNEPSLTYSIIGRSLKDLHKIPKSEKKLFMKDFDNLIKEYSTHTEETEKDKIETF